MTRLICALIGRHRAINAYDNQHRVVTLCLRCGEKGVRS